MRRLKRGSVGFTLAETIITLLLFSIFSTAVVATISATLNFWTLSNSRILAMQNVRISMQFITNEFRQSTMDSDAYSGWASIGLTRPTPLLFPNNGNVINNTTTIQCTTSTVPTSYTGSTGACPLVFTEPNEANYVPTGAGFNSSESFCYQRVLFYVKPNNQASNPTNANADELHRIITTYTGAGSNTAVNTVTDSVVATASLSPDPKASGHISLTCSNYTTTNSNALTVTVAAVEGVNVFTLSTTVASLGQ
jgi:Tfp pilus assembly protein PilV